MFLISAIKQMELTLTVEIAAVEFRRLNSFEWAALSLLDGFGDDASDPGRSPSRQDGFHFLKS